MRARLLAVAIAATAFFPQEREVPTLPEVGKPAPTFRLNDHEGRAVQIGPREEDQQDVWTVLAFFPKAATPG